jgi:hypothetical protein
MILQTILSILVSSTSPNCVSPTEAKGVPITIDGNREKRRNGHFVCRRSRAVCFVIMTPNGDADAKSEITSPCGTDLIQVILPDEKKSFYMKDVKITEDIDTKDIEVEFIEVQCESGN